MIEDKVTFVKTAIKLLTQTLNNSTDPEACTMCQQWIDIFGKFNGDVEFAFKKDTDELRLWFAFENQKDNILAQLQNTNAEESQELQTVLGDGTTDQTISTPPVSNLPLVLDDEQSALIAAPGLSVPKTDNIQSSEKTASTEYMPDVVEVANLSTPTPATSSLQSFFQKPKQLAAAFNDNLCASLENAFQAESIQSTTQFEALMQRLNQIDVNMRKDFKQEIHDAENRVNAKLLAIFKTTVISANNTEAMSGLFNTSSKSQHIPEFKDC